VRFIALRKFPFVRSTGHYASTCYSAGVADAHRDPGLYVVATDFFEEITDCFVQWGAIRRSWGVREE
jgi:hypothetical protein